MKGLLRISSCSLSLFGPVSRFSLIDFSRNGILTGILFLEKLVEESKFLTDRRMTCLRQRRLRGSVCERLFAGCDWSASIRKWCLMRGALLYHVFLLSLRRILLLLGFSLFYLRNHNSTKQIKIIELNENFCMGSVLFSRQTRSD